MLLEPACESVDTSARRLDRLTQIFNRVEETRVNSRSRSESRHRKSKVLKQGGVFEYQ